MSGLIRQLAIQFASLILILSLVWPWYGVRAEPIDMQQLALAVGGLAFLIASMTRQPWWWRVIHMAFGPLMWWVSQWHLQPIWFFAGFLLLFLLQRSAASGQIPLYLTGGRTVDVLTRIIDERGATIFVDLGAGVGSTLIPLSKRFPQTRFVGIENSPLPWLLGWLRSRGCPNIHWQWGSFWDYPLQEADVVYAFLSPAPMPRLWKKVRQEMRPGQLLVSNSFSVPGVAKDSSIQVPGADNELYCYLTRGPGA